MTRISSEMTWFNKRVFPALWLGMIGLFMAVLAYTGGAQPRTYGILAFIAGFGFVVMRWMIFDLMDEVYDDGDQLVIRNGGAEQRVALKDIVIVSVSKLANPARVTLVLEHAGPLGKELVFSPVRPRSLMPFARNQVANDLTARVFRAREAR